MVGLYYKNVMKNTKKEGKLRFLVYKSGAGYVGVCFELGIVEEEADLNQLFYRLRNGAEAMVKAVVENNLDETHLNKKVGFKYEFMWHLGWALKVKDGFDLKEVKPIANFNIKNAAPVCV
jgi:hypothetical protein